ncbi:hypothetical protein AB1Y20_022269 [Prymnesium parvum]|uniref:Bicarbonate transporter-like transmembrane domain-containing protein n=1 Tax=Prymnesium parvum TaxID=97485 RepID=A0AB34JGF1_PRYPA
MSGDDESASKGDAPTTPDTELLRGEEAAAGAPPREAFASAREEFAARASHCRADYSTACSSFSKSLSASLFMFFATLFSTIALGAHLQLATKNRIGLSEYLVMNSVSGVLHSLLGTQPLLIIRPTGPITAILTKLDTLADTLSVDIDQLLAATGVCVSVLMFTIAFTGVSTHIQRLTPFTHEIFACFVCSIYLYDGISDVVHRFMVNNLENFAVSLFDLNLALLVFGLSVQLQGARRWAFFPSKLRAVIADYAVTIAVVSATLCSYGLDVVSAEVLRIRLPASFAPSNEERPWYSASLATASMTTWLAAAMAAVPISFFFYMDQGISALLCQLPELGLRRGTYFHSTFVALGILNLCGPMMGCPFVTGSLPHSPQFVRALSTHQSDGSPVVAESRLAPALVYLLIGLPLLAPGLIKAVPEAAIDGVLIFVGYEGIVCTGLWRRLLLCVTPKYDVHFPPSMRAIRATRVRQYTLLQVLLLAVCWAVNLSPFGLAVAFVIVALVPFREKLLPMLFSSRELLVLDGPKHASDDAPMATIRDDSSHFRD